MPLRVFKRRLQAGRNGKKLPIYLDKIVAVELTTHLTALRGYDPQLATAEVINFDIAKAGRFVEYFTNYARTSQGDCFGLAAYTVEGLLFDGQTRNITVRHVDHSPTSTTHPGAMYMCARFTDERTYTFNHAMIGLGGNRVLAKWGKGDCAIAIGTIDASIALYGGTVHEVCGLTISG